MERGRLALNEFLAAAPAGRRSFVRSRPDLKEEFRELAPSPIPG
jgi:hypothetical protein